MIDKSWIEKQILEPKCVSVKQYDIYFKFEFEGCELIQERNFYPLIFIADSSDEHEILAETSARGFVEDHVGLAESMFETSHGNERVSKDFVDRIIYKLMVGDMKLVSPEEAKTFF